MLGANSWRRRGSEPLVTSLSYQQTSQRPTTDIAEEEEHAVLEAGSILPQQGNSNVQGDLICNLYAQYVLCSLAFPGCKFSVVAGYFCSTEQGLQPQGRDDHNLPCGSANEATANAASGVQAKTSQQVCNCPCLLIIPDLSFSLLCLPGDFRLL